MGSSPIPGTFMITKLHFSVNVAAPLEKVFEFGSNLDNLPKVQPGYVKILKGKGSHKKNSSFLILFWQGFIPTLWGGIISEYEKNRFFTDIQTFGPFKSWKHTHSFKSIPGGTQIDDDVEYELWGGKIGEWINQKYMKKLLKKMYRGRQEKALQHLASL